jgi:hypothetical protein
MSIFLRPELVRIKWYFDFFVLQMQSNGKVDESINWNVNAINNPSIIKK